MRRTAKPSVTSLIQLQSRISSGRMSGREQMNENLESSRRNVRCEGDLQLINALTRNSMSSNYSAHDEFKEVENFREIRGALN